MRRRSNERRSGNRGRAALEIFLQLLLSGLAVGCIYGLVALGFVLIYKATELVNFAQGDLMMLGAFTCYMFITWYGLNYWAGFALAIAVIAAFGALLDRFILRRVIGQPQFAVVMLTIGLGAVFRSFASIAWGSEIYTLPTPFSAQQTMLGGVSISHEYVSIIIGTLLLCSVLYAFFTHTKLGIAMQAASQNQLAAYYMGIPVKLIFSLIWAISAGVAAIAGVQSRLHRPQGLRGRRAGRLRLDPRRAGRRPHHRPHRAVLRRLSATGLQGCSSLYRAAAGAGGAAAGHVRHGRTKAGLILHALHLQDTL
jgi:branched-chain amino acid transport system permease protein